MPLAWQSSLMPRKSPHGQLSTWATSLQLLFAKEKRTKLFASVKSVPNHKKPEAKNLLYTFLSEIILSSSIYNYTGTTRLWRMRKYNTIISSQTATEIWQKSTWAENTLPLPFFPLQLNPCFQMAVNQNPRLGMLPTRLSHNNWAGPESIQWEMSRSIQG